MKRDARHNPIHGMLGGVPNRAGRWRRRRRGTIEPGDQQENHTERDDDAPDPNTASRLQPPVWLKFIGRRWWILTHAVVPRIRYSSSRIVWLVAYPNTGSPGNR